LRREEISAAPIVPPSESASASRPRPSYIALCYPAALAPVQKRQQIKPGRRNDECERESSYGDDGV
jgi:hypothetical protein